MPLSFGRAALYALAGCLFVLPTAWADPSLRVRAESGIELHARHDTDGFYLDGVLQDDLGGGLRQRNIVVRIAKTDDASGGAPFETQTDIDGKFHVALATTQGQYRVTASYEGDDFYERSERSEALDLALANVTLELVIAGKNRIDLDADATRLQLTARSEAGGGGLHVTISDELGRTLAHGTTDGDGLLALDLPSAVLGAAGAGALIAQSAADALRSQSRSRLAVMRVMAPQLELSVAASDEHGAAISGHALTTAGPLVHKAIGIFLDGNHLLTLMTDPKGVFSKRIDWPTDATEATEPSRRVYLQARFEPDVPWLTAGRSRSVAVTIDAPSAPSEAWFLGSALLSMAFAWWLARRALPRSPLHIERMSQPGLHFAMPRRLRAASVRTVDGIVEDAATALPLMAASVSLHAYDRTALQATIVASGHFFFPEIADGKYLLRASAPGYGSVEASIHVPHAGDATGIRIGLLSLREIAIDAHRPVLERIAPSEQKARIWTAREALEQAQTLSTDTTALTHATELVERAAYARPLPTAEEIEVIEARSRDLLAALGASRPRPPRWDR